jgi:nicotinamidase-related amidase
MYGINPAIIDRVIARRGRLHAYETLEADKTALVIIDLQNYFMKPGFRSAVEAAQHIVPAVNRAAAAVRAKGGTVVWIQTSSNGAEHYWSVAHKHLSTPEGDLARRAGLKEGSEGYALWHELDVKDSDLKVIKRTYSALIHGASSLESELRGRNIDTVLIGGTVTNVCCESTARDAMMLNFKVVMLDDALAAKRPEAHVATLSSFIENFGDVMTVDEMAQRLR